MFRIEETWRAMRRVGLVLLASSVAAVSSVAQPPAPPETFTGTTANMSAPGVELRINVLRWSEEADREEVLAVIEPALEGASADEGNGESISEALQELPTVGFIWTGGSLGYALKYTHRTEQPDGGEHLVLVTDRPLGLWDRSGPWRDGDTEPRGFTVVDLRLDAEGNGEGRMSLAAPLVVDAEQQTVGLGGDQPVPVHLENAQREPLPYWAR
jgi:hypothetical protein